jgi:hypothetical protein
MDEQEGEKAEAVEISEWCSLRMREWMPVDLGMSHVL